MSDKDKKANKRLKKESKKRIHQVVPTEDETKTNKNIDDADNESDSNPIITSKEKKKKKRSKDTTTIERDNNKKQKKRSKKSVTIDDLANLSTNNNTQKKRTLPFEIKYILAPMVGASELPFRLLCRKYGAQLAYTPMLSSERFVSDEAYRNQELPGISQDRPLVAHFSANDPKIFSKVAEIIEKNDLADAIDLNLGCPQRTAYVGHFGSYLLDPKDRQLILDMIQSACSVVKSLPVFVKIRLQDTVEDTITLCQQLCNAGASLIAIHARYKASFERKGTGARDGPALLDQVKLIREAVGDSIHIISNGNVITYQDVQNNLESTQADGIMSAEGILDNPALFLPRYGKTKDKIESSFPIPYLSHTKNSTNSVTNDDEDNNTSNSSSNANNIIKRKLMKKLREVHTIEEKVKLSGEDSLNSDQKQKLELKDHIEAKIAFVTSSPTSTSTGTTSPTTSITINTSATASLQSLYMQSQNKLDLASEYLILVQHYPHIPHRTVIFHTRRIAKELLNQYQLMEESIKSQNIEALQQIIQKCYDYQLNPNLFQYDKEKQKQQMLDIKIKKDQEKNRKRFEERMVRKAKREGKDDAEYYIKQGLDYIPSCQDVHDVKKLESKQEQVEMWKCKNFGQHCLMYHLNCCNREKSCAFLHVGATDNNSFHEEEEVNG